MLPTFSPVTRSHSLRLGSSEHEAQAYIIKFTLLWDVTQHSLVQGVTYISKKNVTTTFFCHWKWKNQSLLNSWWRARDCFLSITEHIYLPTEIISHYKHTVHICGLHNPSHCTVPNRHRWMFVTHSLNKNLLIFLAKFTQKTYILNDN